MRKQRLGRIHAEEQLAFLTRHMLCTVHANYSIGSLWHKVSNLNIDDLDLDLGEIGGTVVWEA